MNVKIVDVIVLYCTVRPIFEEGKIKLCKLKKKRRESCSIWIFQIRVKHFLYS